jgi:hypothetical protein
MSGLEWLNELMTWLARWVPRVTLVRAGHVGVLFGPGGRATSKSAGLVCYWPITHELQAVSTRLRTTELSAQLHGGQAISLVVLFQIANPLQALLTLNDVFSTIDDRAQAHLARAVDPQHDPYRPNADICAAVREALAGELGDKGVDIVSVDIAQRGPIVPIKMLSDYAQHSAAEL